MNKLFAVDAHVHLHEIFHNNNFLNAACSNFTNLFNKLNKFDIGVGFLLLTETENVNYFQKLKSISDVKTT